jgi:hypothetical protein
MTVDGEIRPSPGPPPEVPSAWVNFSAQLGDISSGIAQLVNGAQAMRNTTPQETPLVASGVVPASQTLVMDLGQPAMGRRWSVRSLAVVSGAGPTGTLAGVANWYVGNPNAFGAGEWAAPTMATLPAFQFVSSDQLNVTATNHLFCVLTGGTATQAAFARAYILDYPLYAGAPTIEL